MVLVVAQDCPTLTEPDFGPFPREVDFVISALEAGPRPILERQRQRRTPYRSRALLKLYSDPEEASASLLYTRHISPRAVGFLSDRLFALSHGGVLQLASPGGEPIEIACTVLRCRQVCPGWYEGALYFNREQPMFAAEELTVTMAKEE